MSIKASNRLIDGVTVIDLSGRLVLGDGSSLLRETIKSLLAADKKKILINLGDVSYIDSSGLGSLVSAYTSANAQQGQMKLVNLTTKVHELLQITKLLTVFEVFTDAGTPIQSFS